MLNPFNQLIGKPFVHTLVYYRNPKCASSSLYSAFSHRNLFVREQKFLDRVLSKEKKYQGVFATSHITPAESFRLFGRGILNFLTITSVRNPYERTVSQFAFSNGKKGWGAMYGLPDQGSFKDFCEAIYKMRKNPHFWPAITQTVYSHSNVVPIQCILRFENLQKDWSKMLKEFGIQGLPETLPWENKTNHAPWQEYYGDIEKGIVQEIFEEDFLNNGYSMSF